MRGHPATLHSILRACWCTGRCPAVFPGVFPRCSMCLWHSDSGRTLSLLRGISGVSVGACDCAICFATHLAHAKACEKTHYLVVTVRIPPVFTLAAYTIGFKGRVDWCSSADFHDLGGGGGIMRRLGFFWVTEFFRVWRDWRCSRWSFGSYSRCFSPFSTGNSILGGHCLPVGGRWCLSVGAAIHVVLFAAHPCPRRSVGTPSPRGGCGSRSPSLTFVIFFFFLDKRCIRQRRIVTNCLIT